MPLSLSALVRRYILRLVIAPALLVLCVATLSMVGLLRWMDRQAEGALLEGNMPQLEQFVASGNSIELGRQLRAIAATRQWRSISVVDGNNRILAAYPEVNKMGTKSIPQECRLRREIRSSWGASLGVLCWEEASIKRGLPILVAFCLPLALLCWVQFASMLHVGRLLRRHSSRLGELASEFTSSGLGPAARPPIQPFETAEEAQLSDAISNFLNAERKAADAEKAAERDRALSEIAAQVAHDIRSPLTALETAASASDGGQGPDQTLLKDAISRIRSIAEDLLDRDRRTLRGAGSPSSKAISLLQLTSMVESLLPLWRPKDSPGVALKLQHNPTSLHMATALDSIGFTRLMTNIVENSVQAVRGQGLVTISLEPGERDLAVIVKDDGIGIPHDILAQVGQRGATFGKEGGNGLGLWHAKKTVESWGGRLEIESEVGKGTTVRLILPKADATDAPPPYSAVLIDDDPLVRMNWAVAAKRAGKPLKAYPDAASFIKEAGECARDTPIYIDSDLGEGAKGEDAAKELLALGFTELRLATGHDPASFPPLPHIKAIQGKEPPWPTSTST